MAEYIEREALMRRIKEIHCAECDSYHGVRCKACWVDDTLDYIDSEPAADVAPVVRCKDCKHYDLGVCLKIYSDGNMHTEAWQSRRHEDFCSYGERRGGADNG